MPWIVSQIGAREHFAIPRALTAGGELLEVLTDFWIEPDSRLGSFPALKRLRDRYHPDLSAASVWAPNMRMLAFEIVHRGRKTNGWERTIPRNDRFQKLAIARLKKLRQTLGSGQNREITLFSYSYAALELFRYAKDAGWNTVLGQMDPGPEEERIVQAEHQRYPHLPSRWQPAPAEYWARWREEVDLADRVIVNSPWSRSCLEKEGISAKKVEVIPLVYQPAGVSSAAPTKNDGATTILFLGQVNLRKGVARLLDAMRLLRDEDIQLVMAGPSDLASDAWADLPNVRWLGPVPRSEVSRLYQSADFFILPTLSDGYALTQLEALAHGLPVIASMRCGEAVTPGVNGSLLEGLEPAEIANEILTTSKLHFEAVSAPRFHLTDLCARLIAAPSHQV